MKCPKCIPGEMVRRRRFWWQRLLFGVRREVCDICGHARLRFGRAAAAQEAPVTSR